MFAYAFSSASVISKTSKRGLSFHSSVFLFFLTNFLLRLNSSTKANGRYHCCSLDPKRRKDSSATEKSVPDSVELPKGRELAAQATNTSLCKSSTTRQKTLVSLGTKSRSQSVVGTEEWKTKTVAAASELGKMLGNMRGAASTPRCLTEEDFVPR